MEHSLLQVIDVRRFQVDSHDTSLVVFDEQLVRTVAGVHRWERSLIVS
jgi:hypothetical protein